MITRVYLTQFGSWWSLTPREWWKLCREAESGTSEPDLGRFRELTGKPACIYQKGRDLWPKPGSGALVFAPLDWNREEWTDKWNQIDALIGPEEKAA